MKLKNFAFFILLAFFVFLPFLWIPQGYLINSEDKGLMNYETLIPSAAYSWMDKFAYGDVAGPSNHSLVIPLGVFYYLLKYYLHLDSSLIQRIYFSLIILVLEISFFYFSKLFTNNKTIFLSGFAVYFLNFFVQNSFTFPAKIFQVILLPLSFFLFYRYLETSQKRYAALNFIVYFIFQGVFTNISQFIAVLPAYLFALVLFCIRYETSIKKMMRHIWSFFVIVLPIYFYQLIVWLFYYLNISNDLDKVPGFSQHYSNLSRILQFRGVWWENGSYKNIAYNPWLGFYDNKFIIIAGFLVVGFIFFLNYKLRAKKEVLLWSALFLTFIALSSGLIILPGVYEFLLNKCLFFDMFREPWAKFMPVVMLLFSIMTFYAMESIKHRKKFILIFFCFFTLVAIKGYPFFSQEFYPKNQEYRQTFIKPPTYWWEYKEWTRKLDDKNILPIPYFNSDFDWRYGWYGANKPGNYNSNMSYIFSSAKTFYPLIGYRPSEVADEFIKNSSLDFIKLGRVDYVLAEKDMIFLDNSDKYIWQNDAIRNYIDENPVAQFGDKLFVYRIKKEYQLPHFYTAKKIIFLKRGPEMLPKITAAPDYNLRTAIFVSSDNEDKMQRIKNLVPDGNSGWVSDNGNNTGPILEFAEVNPAKYRLRIHYAKSELPLIFSENFNVLWKLYLMDSGDLGKNYPDQSAKEIQGTIQNDKLSYGNFFETWFRRPIENDKNHLEVNGFANSWIIDPQKLCSENLRKCKINSDGTYDFEIVVEFWPQRLYDFSLIASLLIFFVCIGYLGYDMVRKKSIDKPKKNVEAS